MEHDDGDGVEPAVLGEVARERRPHYAGTGGVDDDVGAGEREVRVSLSSSETICYIGE